MDVRGSGIGVDAVTLQLGCAGVDRSGDAGVELVDLTGQPHDAPGEKSQREGCRARRVAGISRAGARSLKPCLRTGR